MQWFKNLRLAVKLVSAFGSVILLMLGVGVLALVQMASLKDRTDELKDKWMPSIRLVSTLTGETSDHRIAEFQHVVSTDDAGMDRYEEVLKRNNAHRAQIEGEYVKLISSAEERQLWEQFKAQWRDYTVTHGQLIRLSRSNQNEQAAELLKGSSQQQFDAAHATLARLVDLNVKGGEAAKQQAADTYTAAGTTVIGVLIAASVLGLGLAIVLARLISRPIQDAVAFADRVASGDLTSRIEAPTRDETGQLLGALDKMSQGLVQIVSQVRLSSDSIATGASQIDSGNADLSQRTEEQAANLEETAASMEELSATVRQNADTARTAAQLATTATGAAARGGDVVGQVVQTMEDISSSSRRIVDIIGTIDGIAFQTNILALNAAVEAARAGEQGRGFAVVAGEVRTLAQRAADAAKEIKSLITANMERVDSGTRQVAEAGQAMSDLVGQVQRVNDLISEISAATHEQTSGISQVSDAVSQLDQVTQQNAALVEESAAAAGSLSQQARSLVQVVGAFRVNESDAARASAAPSTAGRSNLAPPAHNALVGSSRSLPTGLKAQPAARPQTAISSTPSASPVAMPAPAAVSPKAAAPVAAGDDWETF
jgi:methyl-accepting chemotaxis protein